MGKYDALPSGSDSNFELAPETTAFFGALSRLSKLRGRVNDISWHVEHLAARPETAKVFEPMQTFNRLHQVHGFEAALRSVNLDRPEGIPVEVIGYDDGGNQDVCGGKVVALLGSSEEKHGVYDGLAVTDLGEGPDIINVALWANFPGKAYRA